MQTPLHWLLAHSMAASVLIWQSSVVADAPRADAPSDEAVMEQRRIQAKDKYQQGAAAYAASRYKDAVDLFLSADHLAPSAPLSFNIARADEKLGDDSGALRWYRDYLRRSPAASNAESVRSLVAGLARALQKKGVQQMTVISTPAGATVTVDDQPVGVTPWTGELSPGPHRLLLTLRGYSDTQHELDLPPADPQDLIVRLEPQGAAAVPVGPAPVAPASGFPEPKPELPPRRRKALGVVPWVTLGAGAAALGGALTFELSRRSAESDAKREVTQLGYQDRLQVEQSRQTTARVFLGVGGAFAAAGAVMLLLDTGAPSKPASSAIFCVPGACGVSARGQF